MLDHDRTVGLMDFDGMTFTIGPVMLAPDPSTEIIFRPHFVFFRMIGVVLFWAESFTDDNGVAVDNLNLRASIDASEDILELEVISGTVNWAGVASAFAASESFSRVTEMVS